MTNVTLDTPVVLAPATEAVTTGTFTVLMYEENYGWGVDPDQPRPTFGMAQPGSVVAEVLLSSTPWNTRRVTVWQGEAYKAVRDSWGDAELFARIKGILEGSLSADSPA